MNAHPTWVERDAFHLGAPSDEISRHAAACAECQAVLQRLAEPADPPAWLSGVEVKTKREARVRWAAAGASLALAASLALFLASPASELREKSTPAISVFARHGGRVAPWDGRSPFSAGDAIRFEVFSAGMRHVAVVSRPASGQPLQRLYEGPLAPGQAEPLPLSFTFDDAPGAETVWVILSEAPLSEATLRTAIEREPREHGVWVTRLTFPRETP